DADTRADAGTASDAASVRGTDESPSDRRVPFWKRFAAMYVLGLTGVAALGLAVAGLLPGVPGLSVVPSSSVVLAAVLNSALLVAAAVAVGTALAPRLGLRSHVLDRVGRGDPVLRPLRAELPLAVGVGVAAFLATVALDALFAPFVAVSLTGATATAPTVAGLVGSLPFRMLYGGVTEELLLRWGFMTLVAWPLWIAARRLSGSSAVGPSAAVMWTATVVAAVAFGVGHLPAAATIAPLTAAFAARTVALNAVVGVALGWLFWRRSIEAAMLAHASFHVALVAVSAVALLLA
ncbi:MAG: CPBP family intramembrane glutamic endopeptidase, partial [Salinigranum sp.]